MALACSYMVAGAQQALAAAASCEKLNSQACRWTAKRSLGAQLRTGSRPAGEQFACMPAAPRQAVCQPGSPGLIYDAVITLHVTSNSPTHPNLKPRAAHAGGRSCKRTRGVADFARAAPRGRDAHGNVVASRGIIGRFVCVFFPCRKHAAPRSLLPIVMQVPIRAAAAAATAAAAPPAAPPPARRAAGTGVRWPKIWL